MNRKQKVAIVVGALVIAGLALFPPQGDGYNRRPRWRYEDTYWTNRIDRAAMHDFQLAALALTVAAVLVLRGKKA